MEASGWTSVGGRRLEASRQPWPFQIKDREAPLWQLRVRVIGDLAVSGSDLGLSMPEWVLRFLGISPCRKESGIPIALT